MKLKLFTLSLSLAIAFTGMAKLKELPRDPDVRMGTLENGLTYYIRHNEKPAQQADFFLAQRVGSIQEAENQRGLAHFLEHMCFNGTRHFPGNSLISYLESIGVKFGANLNAYTSTDETVYNICRVPASRKTALDSCLLIMRDWSHDLLLTDEEINSERGVIVGEWRQRQGSPNNRLLEKAAPEIYAGNIYGSRLPIGLMSVVENFDTETLREYYRRWYHPVNQAVIVVGDVDVDAIEAEIRRLWSDIPAAPELAAAAVSVPDNKDIIATVQSDPEQQLPMVTLYAKHNELADSLSNTIEELRTDITSDLVCAMLVDRFDELEQQANAPFANAGIGDMKFLLSRTRHALMVRSQAKTNREVETITAYASLLKQAARHGFTETELKRAKIDAKSKFDNEFANRASNENTMYARKYVRHYLDGGALLSPEQYYKMTKGVLSHITLERVNSYIRNVIAQDNSNIVLVAYVPTASTLTKVDIANAYKSVNEDSLTAFVDEDITGSLIDKLPTPGKIIKEEKLDRFGSTVWTLSNGVRVHFRPNTAKADQVLIQGYSLGGLSQNYDPKRGSEYRMINDILSVSAIGDYTTSKLRKLLVGKTIRHDIKIEETRECMGIAATPGDMETAFQLIYLKATDLRKDPVAFNNMLENKRMRLTSTVTNPTYIMADSIHSHIFSHHPLGLKVSLADVDNVSYDTAMDIYRERFGDMSDFTFYVTGNFNVDSLRLYAEQYLGALPGAGRTEKPQDIGYRYLPGTQRVDFSCPMEVKQSICYTFYHTPCEYNVKNLVKGHMLGTLISNALREDLREKRGWTYSVKCHIGLTGGINGDDPSEMIMPVYIRVAPEKADSTFTIVNETVESFANVKAISDTEIQKVKENMLKNYADSGDSNAYWISVLNAYDRYGQDMRTEYANLVRAIKAKDLADFARRHLGKDKPARTSLLMAPQAE